MRLQDLCQAIAKQIGWDGQGDLYKYLLDHLPEMTLGASQSNQTIDKIADCMGWDEDYKREYKVKEKFVWHCFEQAYNHYTKVAKRYQEMEQAIIPIQHDLDTTKQAQLDLQREFDLLSKENADLRKDNDLLKGRLSQVKSR